MDDQRINFRRFFHDNQQLFYDLFRDKILTFLPFMNWVRFRRVSSTINKIISSTVNNYKEFSSENMKSIIRSEKENASEEDVNKITQTILLNFKFRSYTFTIDQQSQDLLEIFMVDLYHHNHRLEVLNLRLPVGTDVFKKISLGILISRYRSIESFSLSIDCDRTAIRNCYDSDEIQFLHQLLKEKKCVEVKLMGLHVGNELCSIINEYGISKLTVVSQYHDGDFFLQSNDWKSFLERVNVKNLKFVAVVNRNINNESFSKSFLEVIDKNENIRIVHAFIDIRPFLLNSINFVDSNVTMSDFKSFYEKNNYITELRGVSVNLKGGKDLSDIEELETILMSKIDTKLQNINVFITSNTDSVEVIWLRRFFRLIQNVNDNLVIEEYFHFHLDCESLEETFKDIGFKDLDIFMKKVANLKKISLSFGEDSSLGTHGCFWSKFFDGIYGVDKRSGEKYYR